MHEISLVRTIFNTLEHEFTAEELENMKSIDLKVGLLSNIEPQLMQNAFEAVTTTEDKHQNVQLNIELVPIEIHCDLCGHDTLVQQYRFLCDNCGRPSNNIIRGTELLIHRVHFHEKTAKGEAV